MISIDKALNPQNVTGVLEASRLVIQAGALAQGGQIFILDMGEPVKIVDLAKKIVKLSGSTEKEIQITEASIHLEGILYEELMVDSDKITEQVFEKIFVGKVTDMPVDRVLEFVEHLDDCSIEELRTEIIAFANGKVDMDSEIEMSNGKGLVGELLNV